MTHERSLVAACEFEDSLVSSEQENRSIGIVKRFRNIFSFANKEPVCTETFLTVDLFTLGYMLFLQRAKVNLIFFFHFAAGSPAAGGFKG